MQIDQTKRSLGSRKTWIPERWCFLCLLCLVGAAWSSGLLAQGLSYDETTEKACILPDNLLKFLKTRPPANGELIENLRQEQKKLARARVNKRMNVPVMTVRGRTIFRSEDDRDAAIQRNERFIAELNKVRWDLKRLDYRNLRVGSLGHEEALYLANRIDDNNAIVKIDKTIDPVLWFQGDVRNLADGDYVPIDHFGCYITGTKQYENVRGGVKTVLVVRPLVDVVKELEEKEAKAKEDKSGGDKQ